MVSDRLVRPACWGGKALYPPRLFRTDFVCFNWISGGLLADFNMR